MKLLKNFPFWVAFYIAVVGIVLIFITVIQTHYIEFKEPNKYFVTVGSFILFLLGVVYGYLALRGKLNPKGPSVTEIRKQSVEKIKTTGKNYKRWIRKRPKSEFMTSELEMAWLANA